MNARHLWSLGSTGFPLVTLALVACVNTVRFPPDLFAFTETVDSGFTELVGDTAQPSPPVETGEAELVEIRRAWETCDEGGLSLELLTTGWSTEVLFDVLHVDGRVETHPMRLVDVDPNGNYDQWAVDLGHGTTTDPGSVSQFHCLDDDPSLTYAIRLRTEPENLSDCGVWGVSPNAMDLWLTVNEPAYRGTCQSLDL
ncbi:MAG: hypothetical protein AAGA48_07955 [Myxococcota bacterium]